MSLGGIYEIENKVSGHKYVGSSVDVKRRWQQHKSMLRNGNHTNNHLQNAWNKYGEKAFTFKVIVYLEPKELLGIENLLLSSGNYEYNIAKDATAPMLGKTFSKEHRENLSKARRKLSLSGKNNPMFGKTHTEKARRKMRKNRKDTHGKNNPMYGKKGKDNPNYGREVSEEFLLKMSMLNTKENNPAWINISRKDIEKMKKLKKSGKTYKEIGELFGVSSTTVRRRVLDISRAKYVGAS